jgi:rod shape-determining protein MreC
MLLRERRIPIRLVILITLLIFIGGLLFFPNKEKSSWYMKGLSVIVLPAQQLFSTIYKNTAGKVGEIVISSTLVDENLRLQKRVGSLEAQLHDLSEAEKENERLRNLLNYSFYTKRNYITGRVISNDPAAEFESITIGLGSKDGLKRGMTVVNHKGLVGRVGKVYPHSSVVLLMTDANYAVDVSVERSRARGILTGGGGSVLLRHGLMISRLEFLNQKTDILEGDTLITSGLDNAHPPGIRVGEVAYIEEDARGLFKESDVIPFVDFSRLEEILVINTQ